MEPDHNMQRAAGGFPVDRPVDALKADHSLIRQLFETYRNTQDLSQKKEIGPRILLLLEMHTSMEEGVFYPRVSDIAASLVDRCEADHQQAKQLMTRLGTMEEGDPQTEQLFRELADAMLRHIEFEEQQLFPRVQQSGLDMHAIGMDMRAFENSLFASGDQPMHRRGIRQ
ncbi:hemerythrin domain-containing protein [Noviherbaspirillum saxi]|uniref:Hemerythrin domain-containing protein n=1 Tax=Noviherbaspirillum saxi TaxID=2320863 RepID=A0A3A3FX79_9BURK|nr:hemerythrin domain-containing protein [Noviherbaspirillum saxi]RJF99278.1 hemerythrin domain-containing protein [Noviherbaspirillum saxi]